MCRADGRLTAATVADHVAPHRGDAAAFWRGELQSLCKACHDGRKQQAERLGYLPDVDAAGLPIDPAHPFNR